MEITSVHNPRIQGAARLRERRGRQEQGRIIIDGLREVSRALEAGLAIVELFYVEELCRDSRHTALLERAAAGGRELVAVVPRVMEKLAYGNRAEGVVAVAATPRHGLADLPLTADSLVAVVEGIEKPGNLGAILRTADAAGVAAMIVADGGTDLYNPNAIRASLGAIFTVPVCEATSNDVLAWLRAGSFRILAARVGAQLEYPQADYRGRTAIVLGSEAHGLENHWLGPDITPISLPMLGRVDSLNLSAAAAVLFYEALRQRRRAGN